MAHAIIDAHHHIWRQQDLPWLRGPMQARIFGPYEAIRRDYPVEEFIADIAESGVEKSVYVQVNWAPDRFEDEVAWVQGIADRHGWPDAIVGYADLMVDDVRAQLDTLSQYPLMRGIRMQLHWHENEMYRFAPRPDVMNDSRFRKNLARLADFNWSFDLQVFTGQMRDAAEMAAECPGVDFILQHAGMLEDLSDQGRAAWKKGMHGLAAAPNVYCKLSGLGTFLHRNDPEHINDVVNESLRLFTADRCLFGSNFPIEKLWTDYAALVQAYRRAAAGLSESEQAAVFWTTAAKVYGIAGEAA